MRSPGLDRVKVNRGRGARGSPLVVYSPEKMDALRGVFEMLEGRGHESMEGLASSWKEERAAERERIRREVTSSVASVLSFVLRWMA